MRVRHFSFHGVRALDGLKRDLPRKEPDLVVVHGRYTKGKTTFLDTLAAAKERVGPYGSGDGRWEMLPSSSIGAAKVKLDWELSERERARAGLRDDLLSGEPILGRGLAPADPPKVLRALLSQRPDAERGSIHYLHDTRDLSGPASYDATATAFGDRLTTRNGKFADLYDLLDKADQRTARELGAARFSELFPALEIVGLRRTGISFVPVLRDRESGAERTYHQLSLAERHGFLVALYTAKAPIVDSVFLLDAPELGFGDEGAVDIVRALLRWTQHTQVIVATASEAVKKMPEVAHLVELA